MYTKIDFFDINRTPVLYIWRNTAITKNKEKTAEISYIVSSIEYAKVYIFLIVQFGVFLKICTAKYRRISATTCDNKI